MKSFLAAFCLLMACSVCHADDEFVYGDNASFTNPYIYKIDITTGGNVVATYSGLSGNNGRGVVTVGNTMYYTSANTNSIFAYNLATSTDLGAVFSIPGTTGLSTIAYDGTNIYIGDYSGSNHVYKYSLTGTLLNTLTLANCTGFCDGLEFFNQGGIGFLVENRGDNEGPYDVYNATTGALVTSAFINTTGTGIAFDGTDFFVSKFSALDEYDINGNFLNHIVVNGGVNPPGGDGTLIEDLSVDYNLVIPPPPPSGTPEPSSLVLLGTGIAGMAGAIRRKLSRA